MSAGSGGRAGLLLAAAGLLVAAAVGGLMAWRGHGWVLTAGIVVLGVVASVVLVWVLRTVEIGLVGERGWMKVALAVLAVSYVALAVYSLIGLLTPDHVADDVCVANQNPERPVQRAAARRVTLTPTGNDATTPDSNLTVALGRQRRVVTKRQMLAVQAPTASDGARPPGLRTGLRTGAHLQVIATDFVRADGSALPATSIVVNALVIGNDRVEISVCFNPRLQVEQTVSPPATTSVVAGTGGPTSASTTSSSTTTTQPLETRERIADPGRYSGRIVIVDDRVQGLELPVDVTMQYSEWPLMLTVFLGILPFAAFVVFAGQGQNHSLRRETFGTFGWWMRENPVAIGSGVAAAVTAFFARYLSDPAWSGQATEFLALVATVGGAFVTALTIVATGKNLALPVGKAPPPAERAGGKEPAEKAGGKD